MLTERTYGGDKELVKASLPPLPRGRGGHGARGAEASHALEGGGPRLRHPAWEEWADVLPPAPGRRPAGRRAGHVLPCPPGPADPEWAERAYRGGAGSELTFHSGGCQVAGAAGRARGPGGAAGGAREAIVH